MFLVFSEQKSGMFRGWRNGGDQRYYVSGNASCLESPWRKAEISSQLDWRKFSARRIAGGCLARQAEISAALDRCAQAQCAPLSKFGLRRRIATTNRSS